MNSIEGSHRQVMGENAGGAAAVRAMDHRNAQRGQRNARIELRDGRIIPGGDLSQEDVGKHRPGEFQLRRNAYHVVDDGL